MSERSDLRDGIIAFVIFVLLFILSITTPLTLISMGLLPLPALVYTAKHTRKAGFILVLASTAFGVIFGPIWAVVTLMCALAGWGMGQFHHSERLSIRGLLLTGTMTMLAGFFLLLALLNIVEDFNLVQALKQQWTSTAAVYEEIWGQMGLALDERELLEARELMMSLLPFIFLTMAGSITLVNHGLGRLILSRLHVPAVKLPPFREWYFPRSLLAWYIISMIVSFLSNLGTYWYSVGVTATWTIQLLFVVQALSLLAALMFRSVRIKALWLILIVVLCLPIIAIGLLFLYFPLSFLGMLDVGFRFREKMKVT